MKNRIPLRIAGQKYTLAADETEGEEVKLLIAAAASL